MFPDVADKPTQASRFATAWGTRPASSSRAAFAQNSPGCVKSKRGLRLNMANTPKKVKDPTEVALSAIQEALNISDTAADTSRAVSSARNEPSMPPATPAFDEPTFEARPAATDRPVFDPIEEPRQKHRAANDDRETIGQLLQALQKNRPSRNVYTIATVFAGIWPAASAALSFGFLGSIQAAMGQSGGVLVI